MIHLKFLTFQGKKEEIKGSLLYKSMEGIKRENYNYILEELKHYFKEDNKLVKKIDKALKEQRNLKKILEEVERKFEEIG